MTSAIFQTSGKVLVLKEQLIRLVIVDRITGWQSLITLTGNLSGPEALLAGKSLTTFQEDFNHKLYLGYVPWQSRKPLWQ